MEFDEILVPAENLLGKENQGFEIIMSSEYPHQRLTHIPRLTILSSLKPSPTSDCGLVSRPFDSAALPTKTHIDMP